LSNLAMSASNSDEVLTLDKRAGDVMEKKIRFRRLFDVRPTFIFIPSVTLMCGMPPAVMVDG
jgi:hypothetical protein